MDQFLTTRDAARRLNVTDTRVRQMIRDGVILRSIKIGRDHLIPLSEIVELAGKDRKPGRPKKAHDHDL
ncbi:MAG TPA: helix-turn-helix domain-containing protein [Pyrinomonadaceae bacterium]|nr:helix-turn-helix domain-containing protein [Pyrinomonadaceae bacterium]HMP66903.1 helix-turn-helix domain-containing protein [Pyrinomonadaceae bacterium]